MPLELIRGDITVMRVDAVVNAANSRLQRGGGVCGAIFDRTDGTRLQAACDQIGHCSVGDAVLTPSFGLPAPYVIHAVGPIWQGGNHHEETLLRSAYARSLDAARKNHLQSVAFPLISSGIYGYPKPQALSVALSAIGEWLLQDGEDMQVYLVLFDQAAYELGGALYSQVRAYIDERYVAEHTFSRRNAPAEIERQMADMEAAEAALSEPLSIHTLFSQETQNLPSPSIYLSAAPRRLEDVLAQAGESFSEMLFRLIDERGLTDPEVYKRANLDRKLFSKIRSNPQYQPGKGTVLALSIALQLNLDQATDLLRRAGFALSPSSKTDLIVEFFLRQGGGSIHEVNEALFMFDQKTLGRSSLAQMSPGGRPRGRDFMVFCIHQSKGRIQYMKNHHPKLLRTELVFLLDRSGSMSGLEADTIGGYNGLIERQKQEAGECRLTTVLFDDRYEILHDRLDLKSVRPITGREYWVRGNTALLDAIGRTIYHVATAQKYALPQHRADRVLMVITTDGMENASREYNYARVREMICEQKTKYNWEFIFLGANIDAIETAARFGVAPSRAANYHADSRGTQVNYEALSEAVSQMRACGSIEESWSAQIEADYRARGGKKNAGRNHR